MIKESAKEAIFIEPVFKQMIWGGNKLGTEWKYPIPGENTGECWGVSAHHDGDCTIAGGRFGGKRLSQLWKEEPELFGNADSETFPLIVKIIDAQQDLSIQVHPDDNYARVHENGASGKKECWYVLDAPEGATLVVGHNARNKEELISMIEEKRWSEFIREIPVKKGDFIQINPGTVHAIKAGIQVLEIQQNSNLTYRVYDYDRLSNGKPRELHVKKSIDVITVPSKSEEDTIEHALTIEKNKLHRLIACNYYRVWKLETSGEMELPMEEPFLILSVTEGEGLLDGKRIKKGTHLILPHGYGTAKLEGDMQMILSSTAGK